MQTDINLKNEVRLLRSFVIGIAARDKEGNYRPAFVKKILKASAEKSKYRFNPDKFLSQIRYKKSHFI